MAANAAAIRSGAEVHSAPYAVAPVIGHLELDASLTADDWPENGWRRVRLPSGVFGFVADDALRVEVPPPVAAAPAPPAPPATPPAPDSRAPRFRRA